MLVPCEQVPKRIRVNQGVGVHSQDRKNSKVLQNSEKEAEKDIIKTHSRISIRQDRRNCFLLSSQYASMYTYF